MSEKRLYIPTSGEMARIAGIQISNSQDSAEELVVVTADSNGLLIKLLGSSGPDVRPITAKEALDAFNSNGKLVEPTAQLIDPEQEKREKLNTGEDYY